LTNKLEKVDPLVGERLGDYTIQTLIGRGGMAKVYEGYDEKLGRRAAVKVMEIQHDEGDELTQRFIREARSAANLEHPHIVSVYQFGESENLYYMAMKYIEGRTLLNILKRLRSLKHHLEPDQIVGIISQIGSALDYAHQNGVIHRDIKPSNIMLTEDNRAILTDFGLTMKVGSETTLGTAFGTPRYIAPEQAIASHKSVPQSDIYSLGVVLYEMVTGQPPFDGDSPMTLALSHITNYPPPPITIRPDIPHPVQTVILKALEKRPENRWGTATEMANALRDAYRGKEPNVQLSNEVLETPDAIQEVLRPMSSDPDDNASNQKKQPAAYSALDGDNTQILSLQKARAVRMPINPSRMLSRVAVILLLLGVVGAVGLVLNNIVASNLPANEVFMMPVETPKTQVRLIYGNDSFVVFNPNDQVVSLEGISFTRDESNAVPYEAAKFGDRTHRNLGPKQCVQIKVRGLNATTEALPLSCGPQPKVLVYDPAIIFWSLRTENDPKTHFLIKKNNIVVQTCSMLTNTCEFPVS
jgi:serine/threonine protein kinase